MGVPSSGSVSSIPFQRLVWAIPAAYILHVIEESAGGFNGWASQMLGGSIDATVFALANVAFMSVVLALTAWTAITGARSAAFLLVTWTAAHLFWDSLVHLGAAVTLGRYSPGLITGCLIYFPLSLMVAAAGVRDALIGPRTLLVATVLGAGLLAMILLTGHAIR